jgi:MFS family permease
MSEAAGIEKGKKVFYGWWIVLVTSVITGLGFGFYSYGFGAIFKQLSEELQINRAMTSIAAGLGRLESGIEGPLTGWLVDKFSPKWVMMVGVGLAAGGLVLMSYIHSIWLYYFAWGVLLAGGMNLGITIPIDKVLTNWFLKKRGLAMGIKMACLGLSGTIVVPIVTWLTTTFGWRETCFIWGIVMAFCLVLIYLFIKPKGPEHYGMLPDGAKIQTGSAARPEDLIKQGKEYAASVQEDEFTLKEALKTSAFWLILLASMGQSMAMNAITIHTIPFLTDMGINATTAGFMMSLLVFFTAPARFISGVMADRVKKTSLAYLLAGFYFLQCLGITIFLFRPSIVTIYAFLILFGFGCGAPGTLGILMRGRFFGPKAYGSITGIAALISAPIGLIAPIYAGWIFDTTGSYSIAFISFAVLTALATILALCVRPPKKKPVVDVINY